jgi:hypothetical protein
MGIFLISLVTPGSLDLRKQPRKARALASSGGLGDIVLVELVIDRDRLMHAAISGRRYQELRLESNLEWR